MKAYLGIDVGSVSTKFVLIDENAEVCRTLYLRTLADPVGAIREGFKWLTTVVADGIEVTGVGTTGSGRDLAAVMVGADLVKNEITAHAIASIAACAEANTVLEIGGQDSKIIIIRQGVVVDFGMNNICAAGTGSFLEQQCNRIGISIGDFGDLALRSRNPSSIAGRCTVFAETDMIQKQQQGHKIEDIVGGLCYSLVRNYLNTVARGKTVREPILFQGGVAANKGIVDAFEKVLRQKIIVPRHYDVMGAVGVALLSKKKMSKTGSSSRFKGIKYVMEKEFRKECIVCNECEEQCELEKQVEGGMEVAVSGSRCGKWNSGG